MKITKRVAPAFEDYMFDWDYETYLLIGGYGSSKSYNTALKIILKLLKEKRKALVIREVYDTIELSCYDLIYEILDDLDLVTSESSEFKKCLEMRKAKVLATKSPLRFRFTNGSQIVFRGMDKPEKVKSINGVSIVWIEEASEVKFQGYEELLGRIRTPNVSMHFILTCNPVSRENWVYKHFFSDIDENGNRVVFVDEEKFYDKGVLIHNGVYYHHSVPVDNPWLPKKYIARLDQMKTYDYPLYLVARWGRFGASGTRVLPQLMAWPGKPSEFVRRVRELGPENMYFGFDFGFEESFNAVICMSVDAPNETLYIWQEIYMNHITDDRFARTDEMQELKARIEDYNNQGYNKMIVADNEDPKAIQYYRQCGFQIRGCRNKFAGSRLSNTRKVKRFKRIYVSKNCPNTLNELKDLTYAKAKNGDTVYDEFNIDPHTFSAIWYGLDTVTVADYKERQYYSLAGSKMFYHNVPVD